MTKHITLLHTRAQWKMFNHRAGLYARYGKILCSCCEHTNEIPLYGWKQYKQLYSPNYTCTVNYCWATMSNNFASFIWNSPNTMKPQLSEQWSIYSWIPHLRAPFCWGASYLRHRRRFSLVFGFWSLERPCLVCRWIANRRVGRVDEWTVYICQWQCIKLNFETPVGPTVGL